MSVMGTFHNSTTSTLWLHKYCKPLNVCVPFISRISRAKQNREIKGREKGQKYDEIATVFRIIWF